MGKPGTQACTEAETQIDRTVLALSEQMAIYRFRMERNDKILLSALAIGAAAALLVWAIIAGAFTAPSEHGWLYNYQTLITGALALAGATLVLVSGNRQIKHERKLTNQAKEDRANAARIRLATYFETMVDQFEGVMWDIDIWRGENYNMGGIPPGNLLQLPRLALPEIADLPLAEAEELAAFSHDVDRVNALIEFTAFRDGDWDALYLTRLHAADKALKSIGWRNRIGEAINWHQMDVLQQKQQRLEQVIVHENRRQEQE